MIDAGIPEEAANFNLTLFETNPTIAPNPSDTFTQPKSTQVNEEGSYLFQLENHLQTSDGQTMQISMRCNAPDIVLIDDFMSSNECDELCELSKGTLTKSTVVDDKTGEGVNHQARTSQGTYFTLAQNNLVEKIEARISEITGIPAINGEGIQILNYANGGEYKPHFDYFPDNEGGKNN